jgi:hypothetical protein
MVPTYAKLAQNLAGRLKRRAAEYLRLAVAADARGDSVNAERYLTLACDAERGALTMARE